MQHLEEINSLLDRAKDITGSDGKTAKALGVPKTHVSAWRHGKRPCQPEEIAIVASMVGMDGTAWLARATVMKYEGTARGDLLMRALGKALLATGGAIASGGASAAAIFGNTGSSTLDWVLAAYSTMYRNVKFLAIPPRREYA